jgi:hypothetical protein
VHGHRTANAPQLDDGVEVRVHVGKRARLLPPVAFEADVATGSGGEAMVLDEIEFGQQRSAER